MQNVLIFHDLKTSGECIDNPAFNEKSFLLFVFIKIPKPFKNRGRDFSKMGRESTIPAPKIDSGRHVTLTGSQKCSIVQSRNYSNV